MARGPNKLAIDARAQPKSDSHFSSNKLFFFLSLWLLLLRCSVAPLLLFPPGPINLSGRGSYLAVPCSLTRTALPCSVSAKDTPRPGARPGRLRQRGLWIGCYHSEKKLKMRELLTCVD